MKNKKKIVWVPTPTFLYRNYHYKRLTESLPPKSYFLDVGSGNGEFVKYLLNKGFKGEAIDISKKAVEFFEKQIRNTKGVYVKRGDILEELLKNRYLLT